MLWHTSKTKTVWCAFPIAYTLNYTFSYFPCQITIFNFLFLFPRSYSYFHFFMQLLPVKLTYTLKIIVYMTLCKCFFCLFLSVILLNYKSQIGFSFYIDIALDLPRQLKYLVDKTLNCLENICLEVVTQRFSVKKVLLKVLQNFKNICPGK